MKQRNRRLLELANVDAALLSDLSNLRYFAGFTGSSGYAIITKNKNFFLTDSRYKLQSQREVFPFYKINIYKKDVIKHISNILKQIKFTILGLEYSTINYEFVRKLKKELKGVRFKDISEYILTLRSVKDEVELKNIKKSISIAEKSFSEIRNLIKPGVRERDIAIELEYRIKKNGAESIAFPIIVASGSNSALPHAKAGLNKIKNNSVVLIDFGAVYNGYHSDITRTLIIGKIDNILKKSYNVVRDAVNLTIENLRVGVETDELTKKIDLYIRSHGFRDGLIHSLGHGVGLNIHELPVLTKYKKMKLMESNVFTVEPGIYIKGIGGVRIENMVYLENNYARLLTSEN